MEKKEDCSFHKDSYTCERTETKQIEEKGKRITIKTCSKHTILHEQTSEKRSSKMNVVIKATKYIIDIIILFGFNELKMDFWILAIFLL